MKRVSLLSLVLYLAVFSVAKTAYIRVEHVGDVSDKTKASIGRAVEFWNSVITSPAVRTTADTDNVLDGTICLSDKGRYTIKAGESIDGLLILAEEYEFEVGKGVTLGVGSVCIRHNNGMPAVGFIRLNQTAIKDYGNEALDAVVKHEIGHALGIGTLWEGKSLVQNPCLDADEDCDPYYSGKNGIQGYNTLGGRGNLPVANKGSLGSKNGHWREKTFGNELMSPQLNRGPNPASIMTVQSLADLGYQVDVSKAEKYEIPSDGSSGDGDTIDFGDDVPPGQGGGESIEDMNDRLFNEQTRKSIGISAGIAAGIVFVAFSMVFLSIKLRKEPSRGNIPASQTQTPYQTEPKTRNEVEMV